MAVPSGVSLRESPSWKGGHFGRGAAGSQARSAPAGAAGESEPAGARAGPPGLLPPRGRILPGGRPGAGPAQRSGGPALGPHPPGVGVGSRGVFKSRWATLRLPPPRPRWQDTAERQAQRSARPRPRPGLHPGSPARGNGKGPGPPGAPRHAHLPALLSAPSAEGIAGLLDCHRPWVVPTGWGE